MSETLWPSLAPAYLRRARLQAYAALTQPRRLPELGSSSGLDPEELERYHSLCTLDERLAEIQQLEQLDPGQLCDLAASLRGETWPSAQATLLKLLDSPHGNVRIAAARSLSLSGTPEKYKAILSALNKTDFTEEELMITLMRHMRWDLSPEANNRLLQFLQNPGFPPALVLQAAESLQGKHTHERTTALFNVLNNSPFPLQKRAAAIALQRNPFPVVREGILAALEDRDNVADLLLLQALLDGLEAHVIEPPMATEMVYRLLGLYVLHIDHRDVAFTIMKAIASIDPYGVNALRSFLEETKP